jgi:hypothetical protein
VQHSGKSATIGKPARRHWTQSGELGMEARHLDDKGLTICPQCGKHYKPKLDRWCPSESKLSFPFSACGLFGNGVDGRIFLGVTLVQLLLQIYGRKEEEFNGK